MTSNVNKKLNVLHIINSLHKGGKERQCVELCNGFVGKLKKEIVVSLVVLNEDIHYTEVFKSDLNVYIIPRQKKNYLKVAVELYKVIKKVKPDILHTWDIISTICTIPSAIMFGKKHLNGSIRNASLLRMFSADWFMHHFAYYMTDFSLSNSAAALKNRNVPKKKGVYIHNGFNLNRVAHVEPAMDIKKRNMINSEKIVGMVASFEDKKDWETFLKAAQTIVKKRNDVIFISVGDGRTFYTIQRKVCDAHKDKILFLGKVDDVESIISIFDIGVLTTNTKIHEEGISNSIMEYMALKKPVIATDSGGTRELVENEKTGFLVRPFSVTDLADKLEVLLTNPKLAESFGRAGKYRIENEFNFYQFSSKIMNLYKRLIYQ